MIEFFIPLEKIPTVTAQQKRVTWNSRTRTPIFYDGDVLKETKEMFKSKLAEYSPESPISGAVRLIVKWCYGTKDKKKIGKPKITKPDTDNLIKAFKDCMTKVGYWNDDAQVASEINEKYWNDVVGIYVRVEEM